MSEEKELINVYGARVHNLKDIDVEIPRNSLTVITGLSGSGKSSLAFDTIFAEGQRRYIETFSAYARNFLGGLERPDVDKITGLSPVISIEQKTTNKNPRSTVGTTTEIYDYLRLLYARAGVAYSYLSGEKMVKYTEEQIIGLIHRDYQGKKIFMLAPLVRTRKGHYKELFEQVRKKGYLYVRVDGEVREIVHGMKLDRYKNHDIEVVIDKLVVSEKDDKRLKQSVATAMQQGEGLIMIYDADTREVRHYSKRLMCPVTGLSYKEPAPHNFSFNSPQGACPRCKGLGYVNLIDVDKVIPDRNLSIYEGAIAPLGKYKNAMIFWQIEALLEKYDFTIKTPVKDMPDDAIDEILYGSDERIKIKSTLIHTSSDYFVTYEGIVKYIQMMQEKDASATAIYGSRGSNGIVLITTKSGKKGKTQITYNTYFSFDKLSKKLDMMSNAEDFVKYQYEMAELQGKTAVWSNVFDNGKGIDASDFYSGVYGRINSQYGDAYGIDWQDEVFGGSALTQNHNVNVSTGTEKTQVMLSYNYSDQEGLLANHGIKKNSIRAKVNTELYKGVRFDLNTMFSGNSTDGGGAYSGRTQGAEDAPEQKRDLFCPEDRQTGYGVYLQFGRGVDCQTELGRHAYSQAFCQRRSGGYTAVVCAARRNRGGNGTDAPCV